MILTVSRIDNQSKRFLLCKMKERSELIIDFVDETALFILHGGQHKLNERLVKMTENKMT